MAPKKETYNLLCGIDNMHDHSKVIDRPPTSFGGKGRPRVRLLQGANIDLHSDYHISRCKGYTLSLSGTYDSVWSNDEICLCVHNDALKLLNPDFSLTTLLPGISSNVSYISIPDGAKHIVYFTDGVIIGKVVNGVASVLPATTTQFKSVLPPGNLLRFFMGSIYVIRKNIVYLSDIMNREIFDTRWGWKLFDTELTMFEPIKTGIFVSDSSGIHFIKRTGTPDDIAAPRFTSDTVHNVPAVPGTPRILNNITSPSGKSFEQAVVWVSGTTLCLGGPDGAFEQIKSDIYSVPSGRIGASLFRQEGNLNQYITIIR